MNGNKLFEKISGGKRVLRLVAATALLATTVSGAWAQAYPNRPVRLVVGFPSGTGPDLVARIVAHKLQESLGQSVVVENKVGAAGLIATREVAKAAPDGYTLLMGTVGELAISPNTYTKPGFDPIKDFAHISHLVTSDFAFVVPMSIPVKSLKEYVEWGKAQKGVFMGTFGAGTPGHFGAAILADATQIHAEPVHYKNTGDAMTGVITGDAQGLFGTLALVSQHVKSGKLRALATTGPSRSDLLPDVPTAKEQGYPSVEFGAWFGLSAPANTPNEVLNKLSHATMGAMQSPEVREKLQGAGFRLAGTNRQDFERLLRADITRWEKVVKATGFKTQD